MSRDLRSKLIVWDQNHDPKARKAFWWGAPDNILRQTIINRYTDDVVMQQMKCDVECTVDVNDTPEAALAQERDGRGPLSGPGQI